MALQDEFLINKTTLKQMGDKVFGADRGDLPVSFSEILSNMGPDVDFFNKTKYKYTVWNATGSGCVGGLTLPDGISLENIKLLIGVGARNNSSTTARTVQRIPYIYCPALYNNIDNSVHACFGFYLSVYSSTYELDAWTPIGSGNYSYNGSKGYRLGVIQKDQAIYVRIFQDGTLTTTSGYALAGYGSAIAIYKE